MWGVMGGSAPIELLRTLQAPHPPQCAHWGTFPRGGRLFPREKALPLRGRNAEGGVPYKICRFGAL